MDVLPSTKTKNFSNLCHHKDDFGVPAEWYFFATSHGKTAGDGQGRIQEFGRGGSNNYIHKGAEPQKPTPFYYIKLKILHKHVQQI
jgi:hypothetical protein